MFTCPVCKNKKFVNEFRTNDFRYDTKGNFLYKKCKKCSLVIQENQKLGFGYPNQEYYAYNTKHKKNLFSNYLYGLFYTKNLRFVTKLLFFPLKMFTRGTKIKKGYKFLDVGCGAGEFLVKMHSHGMKCYGIEISKKAATSVKNFRVENTQTYKANYKDNFFDVITMNHVLEHSLTPKRDLKKLFKMLKPGATLIIGVPNIDSLAYKIFKKYWVQIDAPRHNYLFSSHNLKILLEDLGFNVKKIRYDSMPFQFSSSLYHYLEDKYNFKLKILFSKIALFLFLPLTIIVNIIGIGDSFEIWVEK